MNEKLNNIFVPVEVAKLAKEKRFNEWCAYFNIFNFELANVGRNMEFRYKTQPKSEIPIPTHFQLIKWLKDNHNIDVQMQHNGLWDIQNKEGEYADLGLEINEALITGLNLIESTKC